MGTVSELCGIETPAPEKKAMSMKDILKQAYVAGDKSMQNQYDFLKFAEELGSEEVPPEVVDDAVTELAVEDEAPIEEVVDEEVGEEVIEEPVVDEVIPDEVIPEGDGEIELIEELIRAISDPEVLSDEDEDATLMAAEAVENAEKEAGINSPTVADYLSMRMGW